MTSESNVAFWMVNSVSCHRDERLNLLDCIHGSASVSFTLHFFSLSGCNPSKRYDFISWANRLEAALYKRCYELVFPYRERGGREEKKTENKTEQENFTANRRTRRSWKRSDISQLGNPWSHPDTVI